MGDIGIRSFSAGASLSLILTRQHEYPSQTRKFTISDSYCFLGREHPPGM